MAKFKIYLINTRSSAQNLNATYNLMPISEFDTEYKEKFYLDDSLQQSTYSATLNQKQNFCYTYNEKFQQHQNTQRTLTFSMNAQVIRADRIENNPFTHYLFVGSQILLVDRYDKHHLMTVSKISYEFKELNTVFNYECQDSFNYQLSRQNTGYEIENNINDTDFIGANSLDWWVLCKIHPDCNISYTYIPLVEDLTITESGNTNIIKNAYSQEQYPEFHKTVPFSGSGTASSVLIALGEMYGLQLAVYERMDFTNNTIRKYYWFEPMKSLKPTGLKYSPKLNLQSFGLEHNGSALSSILNVQSNTIGDELVTLIPSVPGFFKDWFETSDWQQSSYFTGLFTSACQAISQHISFNGVSVNIIDPSDDNTTLQELINSNAKKNVPFFSNTTQCVYIPLDASWFSEKYDYVKFCSNTYQSILTTSFADTQSSSGLDSKTHNAKFSAWELVVFSGNNTQNIAWSNETILPHARLQNITANSNNDKLVFLKLPIEEEVTETITLAGDLYIIQFRNASNEELEFARIADQLPWLENRLVSFQYFYEHSIINLDEFTQLMNIFENDLRKVNAKLLIYSQGYYQALQAKTKVIGDLSGKLDKVGAIFQSDLIDSFASDNRSKKTTEFNLAITDLFANSSDDVSLINYYETLGDYVNKYISAEQTFLKNVYLFKTYFDAKANLGTLYEYTFTISDSANSGDTLVSFSNPNNYIALSTTNAHNPIFEKVEDSYVLFDKSKIISSVNGLYYLNATRDNKVKITFDNINQNLFTKDQTYYEAQWIVTMPDSFTWPQNSKNIDERKIIGVTSSGDKFEFEKINSTIYARCYKHCLHTTEIESFPSVTINGINTTPVLSQTIFVKTNLAEMRINYLYKTSQQQNTKLKNKRVHIRKTDFESNLCSIDNSSSSTNWAVSFNDLGISWKLLQSQANSKNWSANRLNAKTADEIYKECFPITSLYWYGKEQFKNGAQATNNEYHSVPLVNIENCSQFQRRVSISLENYQKHQVATCVLGGAGVLGLLPFLPFGLLATVVVAPAFWGISELIWNNGEKPFDCSGWTYHDVFNCDYDTFQDWCGLTDRLIYTTNGDGYKSTNQRNVFSSASFDGETWKGTDATKIQSSMWGYNEAKNLLFTYQSLTKRLAKKDAQKYHYKTTYWRLLNKNDYVNRTDSLYVLYIKDNDKTIPDITKLKYISLELDTIDGESNKLKRLNSAVYYPLKSDFFNVSTADFVWDNEDIKYLTLNDLLKPEATSGFQNMKGAWQQNGDITPLYDARTEVTALFFKEENWQYKDLKDYSLKTNETDSYGFIDLEDLVYCASQNLYDNTTHQQLNWLTDLNDLTLDFYVVGIEDEDYILADNTTTFDDSFEWYAKVNDSFERRYTINQLIQKTGYYVKAGNRYIYQSFAEIEEIRVPYNIYEEVDSGKYKLLEQFNNGKIKRDNNEYKLHMENGNTITLTKNINIETLNDYTNGSFWYAYRNSSSSLLCEKAMLIETNLTEYWTNAYYASKNCKYFLPEHWQPTVNHKTNYFSSNVLSSTIRPSYFHDIILEETTQDYYKIQLEEDGEQYKVLSVAFERDISNITINPITYTIKLGDSQTSKEISSFTISDEAKHIVQISYSFDESTVGTVDLAVYCNAQTAFIVLPKNIQWPGTSGDSESDWAQIEFDTITFSIAVESFTSHIQLKNQYLPNIVKLSNQPHYLLKHRHSQDTTPTITAQAHNLQMAETTTLSSITSINSAMQNAITYLNLTESDWHATKIKDDHTWYVAIDGGQTWSQTLETLSDGSLTSEMFGGWYDMMIRVLQSCNYVNYIPQQYYQAQEDKRRIWSEIYKKYGHLIYEQSYTNEDATTPEDLLKVAQYAFKDYTQVESNYNISVIDLNTLKGYKSQELKIGDGIEIEADELYSDRNSDIYRSLIQYLYITDINYDLRRDDNIQLTVNSIKYQDKVIGQLIKLIR